MCVCVCLSVCGTVGTITQKIIDFFNQIWYAILYDKNLSWDIAYEQNRPTGVASALNAQFVFLSKRALKMCCTKIVFRLKSLQIKICNFWCKFFFYRPMGLASALVAQLIFFFFFAKTALKMCCTKFFSDKSYYK